MTHLGSRAAGTHYRRDNSQGNAQSAAWTTDASVRRLIFTRQRQASGGRHRLTLRTIPRPGSGTWCHSSFRAQRCSAPTARTHSPAPPTPRTSMRSRSSAHSTSTTRTPDQTDAAIFWQDHAIALWNRIFRTLAASQALDIVESARLFAMENLAAADSQIGGWNDKYYWQFWRPITAIREADTDGNPDTEADPTWLPLFDPATPVCNTPMLFTPPFPDHPSGHACATQCIRAHAQELFRHRQDRASAPSATNPVRRGALTGSPARSRRSSMPECGPASTSAPPTRRERC